MVRMFSLLFLVVGVLLSTPRPAEAQFRFPRLAERRLDAQGDALREQAQRDLALAQARAARAALNGQAFFAPKVFVPHTGFAVTRGNVVFFGAPSAAAYVPGFAAAYTAPPVFATPGLVPLTPLAVPSYGVRASAFCGF